MLPKELRSRRLALGLSLEEFARRAGVEPSLLAGMENGDVPITSAIIATLLRLGGQGQTVTRLDGPR